MDFISLIIFFTVACIAFYAGKLYTEVKILKNIMEGMLARQHAEEMVARAKSLFVPINPVKHEVIDQIHYFFTSDDHFICQGSNFDEAIQKLKEKGTGCKFKHAETGVHYLFIDGELKEESLDA